MANSALTLKRWQKALRCLFPRGVAWVRKEDPNSNLRKLIDSMAIESCRIEERAFELIEEVDPRTTLELLTDWERVLNLPDECEPEPENLTIQERRERIVQVLTTSGSQNKQFYVDLAARFGIIISIDDVNDQPPFLAGRSRAGDRLTNGDWVYAFVINAPVDQAIRFRAGRSRAGDRLLSVTNETLECLINKYKPAHTVALFTFTGEF